MMNARNFIELLGGGGRNPFVLPNCEAALCGSSTD